MQAKSTNKKRASGAQEQGSTTQESFTTKYGPVTIHQSGVIAKELQATPVKDKEKAFALANVRISMHLERFDSTEKLSVEMLCVTRFPEFSHELKHKAPCEMRAGQTHGAAVVQATAISVDFEKGMTRRWKLNTSWAKSHFARHRFRSSSLKVPSKPSVLPSFKVPLSSTRC